MSVVVISERISATEKSFTAPYFVTTDNQAAIPVPEALFQAATRFAAEYGLNPTSHTVDQLADHSYRIVFTYAPSQGEQDDPPQPPLPGVEVDRYEFDFRAEPYVSKVSLGHVYHTQGAPAQLFGKLGVQELTGVNVIETVTIPVPAVTHRIIITRRNSRITSAYIEDLEATFGHVNGSAIGHYGQRTLLLVECRGAPRTAVDWQIDFGFAYRPTRPKGTVIDGVTFNEPIRGHDYAWVYNRHAKLAAGGNDWLLPTGKFGFVERVWPSGSFSQLGIPTIL